MFSIKHLGLALAVVAPFLVATPGAIAQNEGIALIGPEANAEEIRRSFRRSLAAPESTGRSLSAEPNEPPPVAFLVPFEFDSAVPTPEGAVLLAMIGAAIVGDVELAAMSYIVDGHTDSVGKAAYNEHLGQRRADTVLGALIQAGLPLSRLAARSFGETRGLPGLAPSDKRNRRVEITPFE